MLAIKSASSTCAACRSVVSSDQNENLEIKKDGKENIDAIESTKKIESVFEK